MFVIAFSNDRMYFLQRDAPMHTEVPRLTGYGDVDEMS